MNSTKDKLGNETPHFGNTMLAAAADGLRKFVWVGWNKHFQNYWVSDPLTTRQLLERKYPSFFNIENDNCIFVMEIFEGDTLIYYSQNSMSSMTVKIENGVFVGEGEFNTHPLDVYFNATDFVNMERDVSGSLPADLRRKIEIHIETTEECIENFGIPKYVKELLEQDIELYRLILARC